VFDSLQQIELNGMSIAKSYGSDDAARADDLALCDASAFARLVLKGPNAVSFLAGRGISLPEGLYSVASLSDGGIIIRTGASEVFIEDAPAGTLCASLVKDLGYGTDGVYGVPAPSASLILSGARAAEVLLETCNVDFREPNSDAVATRVVGVSCTILFRNLKGHPAFQFWFDGSYGHYLASTLLNIVNEHHGAAAGISAYFEAPHPLGPSPAEGRGELRP
jgi:sarcosine oxidase subunit gamma